MTHLPELDVEAEIANDFTSHLAERLQLAPDMVLAHLEFWLAHYPRARRAAPGLTKAQARPNGPPPQVTVG